MLKTYKTIIIIIPLAVLATAWFCLYPSAKKEIKSEKTEIFNDNSESQPEQSSQAVADSSFSEEKVAKQSDKKASIETAQPNQEKKPSSSFKIIQNLVNWGYSSKSSRSIDTIIIHSSYNILSNDPYDFKKLLEEYKSYGVSPHYVIDRKGNIYQLVKDNNIAYHAGESKMPDGRTNVNNFSIGIEMMNTESDKMAEVQYDSLRKLIDNLKGKYKIKNILGHNQIAPGRKTDPWKFDWSQI